MKQPDIIFIVLDTQRADRLGCYGHDRDITPNLDRLAADGVLFERAVSPAQWTIPSHASMFTGLYPTTHQVVQSDRSLSPDLPHMAEVLQQSGYETIGFCNNPLVGILNNGFKRGFDTFYNYGGAVPSLPAHSSPLPWPLNWMASQYTQFLRRISYPVQNFFGRSDLAFRISLNAWLTPLWSRLANFKGQNARSVRDICHYLEQREQQESEKPLFLFLNLMETHLPFWPPGEFVDKIAPYIREDKEARTVMRTWNREAYRWAAPLPDGLPELDAQVLSDMYDAEVAYQDDYLGQLFSQLNGRLRADNTLTVIVADHGDGLGEHNYFGHAFVAYDELVHVPLIMHWPQRLSGGKRVATPVSSRRVYHTILDAAGRLPDMAHLDPVEVHGLTLMQTINGRDPEHGTAYSEIYPPLNFVKAIESRAPHLLGLFKCLSLRRAIVKQGEDGDIIKLIQLETEATELFNLLVDELEVDNILAEHPALVQQLHGELTQMATAIERRRHTLRDGDEADTEIDEQLLQRLRGLGYID